MYYYQTIRPVSASDEAIKSFFGEVPKEGSLLYQITKLASDTRKLCAKELGIEKEPELAFFKVSSEKDSDYQSVSEVAAFHRYPDNVIYLNLNHLKEAHQVAGLIAHEMKHCQQWEADWQYKQNEYYAEHDANSYERDFLCRNQLSTSTESERTPRIKRVKGIVPPVTGSADIQYC